MDVYQQEYLHTLKLIIKEHQILEYERCLALLYKNIRDNRKYTAFTVSLKKPKCPHWDPVIACKKIMDKLRLDDLNVKYKAPNRLYIIHNKNNSIINPDKKKIYDTMKKENAKTISWLNSYENKKKIRQRKNMGQKRKIL